MNRIKELRAERNLSLRDFSDIIKIPRSTISLYELGTRDIKFESLKRLCDFFEVTSDYLLGFSEEGIYVHFQEKTYSLNRANFLKYKELDFLKLVNNIRTLLLPNNYSINFIYPTIKPIEIKKD
ncbi:MAG: helix-turn-helix transcriptional regulator [Bacilli bacterium]|nr:helix-turn-helix transcriptional regulator [Bacilli bacterium]